MEHIYTGMARVNEGSYMQLYLPPTRLSTSGMNHTCLYSPAQPQSVTALWPVLIFRSVEGRRLSWPQCLVTNRGGLPPQTITRPNTKGDPPLVTSLIESDQRAST